MKFMRKAAAVVVSAMMLAGSFAAFAEEVYCEYEIAEKPITVTYNGADIAFDTEPQIVEERTMVPFRGIFETAGCSVDFDSATSTITAKRGEDETITLKIGDKNVSIAKGTETTTETMEIAPIIIGERTMVPARFVAEALDCKVNWNANYKEVVIIDVNAWKNELKEKSEFFDMLCSMPLNEIEKSLVESVGEMSCTLSLKDFTDKDDMPMDDVDLKVNLTMKETDVFDGENRKSTAVLTADLASLSALEKWIDEQETKDALAEFAKDDLEINLEMLMDKDWNLYLKSEEVMDILRNSGQEKIADQIGDKYLKISLADILEDAFGGQLKDFTQYETLYDMLEAVVSADDHLFTNSVKEIGQMINMYGDMFNNRFVTKTEGKDGETEYTFKMTADDYRTLMRDYMVGMMGDVFEGQKLEDYKAEFDKQLGNMDMNIEMTYTVKDGKPVKSAAKMSMDMKDIQNTNEDGTKADGTTSFGYSFDLTSEQKAYDEKTEKITIPTDVVDIETLLGCPVVEYFSKLAASTPEE